MLSEEEKVTENLPAEVTDTAAYKGLIAAEESTALTKVIQSQNTKELQAQLELFNVAQAKKNVLRLSGINRVLDKADAELERRIDKRPDQISTKELLEIIGNLSTRADRINQMTDQIDEAGKPAIAAVQNNTEINVNVAPQLTKDEKAGVMDAVASLLKQIQKPGPVLHPVEPSDDSAYIDITEENS